MWEVYLSCYVALFLDNGYVYRAFFWALRLVAKFCYFRLLYIQISSFHDPLLLMVHLSAGSFSFMRFAFCVFILSSVFCILCVKAGPFIF